MTGKESIMFHSRNIYKFPVSFQQLVGGNLGCDWYIKFGKSKLLVVCMTCWPTGDFEFLMAEGPRNFYIDLKSIYNPNSAS